MSDDELVTLERGGDGVATVTLSNGKVNALSVAVLGRLGAVASELTTDPARVVVVTGGPRLFAAGADISEFRPGDTARTRKIGAAFLAALDAVAAIPSPTIAAVSGFALGGGCELALACDLRWASSRAKFGQPEILLGIIPGGGGTQRLARLVGPSRAKDLVLSGRQVDAEEAFRIGLVDAVIPADSFEEEVATRAAALAAGPAEAMRLAKAAIDRGLAVGLDEGLRIEQDLFAEVFDTRDAEVGVASFNEHGPGHAQFP